MSSDILFSYISFLPPETEDTRGGSTADDVGHRCTIAAIGKLQGPEVVQSYLRREF